MIYSFYVPTKYVSDVGNMLVKVAPQYPFSSRLDHRTDKTIFEMELPGESLANLLHDSLEIYLKHLNSQ